MADPSRILLVGPVAPPVGGVAAHVDSLAEALRRRDHHVEVADPSHRIAFAAALARAAARRSLIHAHVSGHNAKSFAVVATCAAATRAVVTVHSGLAPAYLASRPPAARRAIAAILQTTRAVIAVSRAIADALGAFLAPERIFVVSPFLGAPRPGAPPPPAAARRAAGARLVACALAPGREYGADLLVAGFARAAPLAPEAHLVVYGPGGAPQAVARALAARGLSDRVTALGELRREDALGLVSIADVFVRPTRADGDAISVREALALGTPVVASDAAARPAGVTRYPTEDAAALAEALARALNRPLPPVGPSPNADADAVARIASIYQEDNPCAASPAV